MTADAAAIAPAASGTAVSAVAGSSPSQGTADPIAVDKAKPGAKGADAPPTDGAPQEAAKAKPSAKLEAEAAAPNGAAAKEAAAAADKPAAQIAVPNFAASASQAAEAAPAQHKQAADPAQAMARADAPVPLQAVAIEIGMRAMRGAKEFAIRLDPEDLGRIDIKLEISDAGDVQARLVVDRVETLQLLQRDARTLERAFDQAGLKTNGDALQFSLRDPGGQGGDRNGDRRQPSDNGRSGAFIDSASAIDDIALRPAAYRMTAAGGLDIRI